MEIAVDVCDDYSEVVMVEASVDKLVEIVCFAEVHQLDVDRVVEVAEHVDVVET